MKKAILIIVLGLLWCNVGFGEIKEIESKKITSHKDKVITTVCVDGYKFVIVAILFIAMLIGLTFIVQYPGSLEPGAPRFFGDSN